MKGIIRGICVTALLVFVQNLSAMELSIGGKIGMNVAGILGDTVTTMMPRIGFTGGLFCSQWINDKFGLQEELGFSFRGETWKDPEKYNTTLAGQYAFQFTYLELPILARWKFMQRENVRPVLYAGPLFAIPIIANSVSLPGNTQEMKDKTQPFDFGLTGGFALEVKYGNAIIPIDVRYVWGATNFVKNPAWEHQKLHHSVVSVSAGLGWILDLKKKKEF